MKSRIQTLAENRAVYAKKEEIPVRDEAYRSMKEKYSSLPEKLQYAYGFAEVLKKKSVQSQKDDILAGYLHQYTYNVNFPMKVKANADPAGRASFAMDVRREAEEYAHLWKSLPTVWRHGFISIGIPDISFLVIRSF